MQRLGVSHDSLYFCDVMPVYAQDLRQGQRVNERSREKVQAIRRCVLSYGAFLRATATEVALRKMSVLITTPS